jgi:hypothetical protein
LSNLVGGYIEAFDEEPLPVEVADHVHRRLLELLASLDLRADSDRRLADINCVAAFDLFALTLKDVRRRVRKISRTRDTAGPMAATMTDVAALDRVIAGGGAIVPANLKQVCACRGRQDDAVQSR